MMDNVVVPVASTYGLADEYRYLRDSINDFLTGMICRPRELYIYIYILFLIMIHENAKWMTFIQERSWRSLREEWDLTKLSTMSSVEASWAT